MVAIATCALLPELDLEGRLVLEALRRRGVEAIPVIWNDSLSWGEFDAVLLRTTWDYFHSIGQFLDWVRELGPRLFNPPEMVEWNSDKRYLLDLRADGISIVTTDYVPPAGEFSLPGGQYVVKPAISAGANDTATYDSTCRDAALRHIRALHDTGRTVLIQPYYSRIDTEAETAMIFIDGDLSHCMRKGPLLGVGRPIEEGPWREEEMSLRTPEADMVELGRATFELVARRFGAPLYARVDAIRDDAGAPAVLELELIEPSLFLGFAAGSADKLALSFARRAALRESKRVADLRGNDGAFGQDSNAHDKEVAT
jgi:hypothetical protein